MIRQNWDSHSNSGDYSQNIWPAGLVHPFGVRQLGLPVLKRKPLVDDQGEDFSAKMVLNQETGGFRSLLIVVLAILAGCSTDYELNWVEEEGYRRAEIQTGFWGSTGFRKLTSSDTGINFRNDVSDELIQENRHYANGSGVAVADINGNGLPDIYFASLKGPNRLYKNLGDYRFEDITEQAGLAHEGYDATGVVFADVNGNDYPDLLITSLTAGNALYVNDGTGSFERKEDSGLGESNGAKTMALADINGNGLLDLYITNYKFKTVHDMYDPAELAIENTMEEVDGQLQILPPFDEHFGIVETAEHSFQNEFGAADELYLNRGDGQFEKTETEDVFMDYQGNPSGLPMDWGLTASFRDITGNGEPDLYVANDFWTPDRLWINQGDGTFRNAGEQAIRNQSFSSMGIDFSDINRNGKMDFVVTEMLSSEHQRRLRQYSDYLAEYRGSTHNHQNSVYLNRGDTTFAQLAYYSGLEATEWSWATYFMDIDLDGYEDIIVANGFYRDYLDMDVQHAMQERYERGHVEELGRSGDLLEYPTLPRVNKMFRNNHDLTFTEKSKDWGFDIKDISMGMATADFNNDGTLDLVINRFNDEALIYENTTNSPRIAVRLNGEAPNTNGIGARIELMGGPVDQTKEMVSGGSYLSGPQPQITFAADGNNENHTIVVTWRDGRQSRIENVRPNTIYEINQAETAVEVPPVSEQSSPDILMFEDISGAIDHDHHESSYDDFRRVQPLLPRELSRQGPGVSWIDYNDNGYDDLVITSGMGGTLALYENLGNGEFQSVEIEGLSAEAPGDQTAALGWAESARFRFVVGSSNYEQENPEVPSAYTYTLGAEGDVDRDSIPGILSTTGPIAAADYNGNGAIDLFIGGSFMPGRYPIDASSRLFTNIGGMFEFDEQNSSRLSDIGLVSSALFADITGNDYQDLLISTEWGSLKLFENRNGRFREITEEVGLDQWHGWWRGVATGDFTNNGRLDIVAANLGLNSPYETKPDHPIKLFYEDFNWNNRLDIVDAYYHEGLEAYVPRRKFHDFGSVPTILRNVSSHEEFATSSVDEIFAQDFNEVSSKKINTLEHMVFINTKEGFEARPLPAKAQFSSAYDISVADFDNDGNEDLFISQNSFEFPNAVPRQDAGRGLILLGNGEGEFEALPGTQSGITIYGEQRAAAVADFNHNGKVDIVVSQNNEQTHLYQNRTETPGLRIRLEGPERNRNAIGSGVRLMYPDGSKGPLRVIQAGSGYRSQNSMTQVLGMNGEPEAIEVHWFDGSTETVDIVKDQLTYEISY